MPTVSVDSLRRSSAPWTTASKWAESSAGVTMTDSIGQTGCAHRRGWAAWPGLVGDDGVMTMNHSIRAASVILSSIVVLSLAGCVWPGTGTETSTPGTISTPTESPTASITPKPTPTTGTPAQPVTIACTALISAQTMYNFNPNFTLQANYAPKSGTAAFTAKTDSGTACNWVNNTSGDTVTASIARPGSDEFATLKTSAATGTPVSGYGDAAYFAAGRVDVFSGAYWVVLQSTYFSTAADAAALTKSVLAQAK